MGDDLKTKGFLDIPIDFSLDLFAEITKLKKEKNAIILAHYYQDADIQEDFAARPAGVRLDVGLAILGRSDAARRGAGQR